MYRSPNQLAEKFEAFFANLEKIIFDIASDHSDFVLSISDSNAKSRNWSNDHITTAEGEPVDSLIVSLSVKQLIVQPKYILQYVKLH